jgi:hypothetical protein
VVCVAAYVHPPQTAAKQPPTQPPTQPPNRTQLFVDTTGWASTFPLARLAGCRVATYVHPPRPSPTTQPPCLSTTNRSTAQPQLFVDTTGWAFTFPLARLAGCRVAAYVHYPTVSSDMIRRVRDGAAMYNNDARISGEGCMNRNNDALRCELREAPLTQLCSHFLAATHQERGPLSPPFITRVAEGIPACSMCLGNNARISGEG